MTDLMRYNATDYGNHVLVVHSGGQDSTTCLAVVRHLLPNAEIHTVSFDYGQKHAVELESARKTAELFNVVKTHDIKVPFLQQNVTTELLASSTGDVCDDHIYLSGRPASFVPVRNALFLTMAYGLALEIGATSVVTGVCQTDYSGYPDCREDFVEQLNAALNTGYENHVPILTPLMHLNKAQTFQLAEDVGALEIILEHSHTCYNGNHTTPHAWGYGCGACPACELRAQGYFKFMSIES